LPLGLAPGDLLADAEERRPCAVPAEHVEQRAGDRRRT
jgi:hypothetical protein